jgi:hypothetical protein
MKRVFYLTFGLLAVLIGSGIAVWLFYNLLIERQAEFTDIWDLRQLFVPFVMIGWGIYWLRKGLRSPNINRGSSNKALPLCKYRIQSYNVAWIGFYFRHNKDGKQFTYGTKERPIV